MLRVLVRVQGVVLVRLEVARLGRVGLDEHEQAPVADPDVQRMNPRRPVGRHGGEERLGVAALVEQFPAPGGQVGLGPCKRFPTLHGPMLAAR